MIATHQTLALGRERDVDVCIIGAGAGGAAAAHLLAGAGRSVVVVERGSFLTPKDFDQREDHMYTKLFYESGGRRTRDRTIRVLHGHGVGGSTLHNINLCKRIPEPVIDAWALRRFSAALLTPYYDKVERLLGVTPLRESDLNRNNSLFKKGVEALGYRGGFLHHNRKGCVGSGFCELGCAFDAKMNALRVLVPEAVKAGCEIWADTRALTLLRDGRRVTALEAETVDPESGAVLARHRVRARVFLCAGGAIETPLLLQRSDTPDPHGLIGQRLHLHPGTVAVGEFDAPVESWRGIPQTYECTELLSFNPRDDKRVWLIAGSAHPAGAAAILPGFGAEHEQWMRKLPHLACLSPMVHDTTSGTVSVKSGTGGLGADVDYNLNAADRVQLSRGLREAGRILLAAGAREVMFPFSTPARARNPAELDALGIAVRDHETDLVAVHPMSTVWMGTEAETSCLDEACRLWAVDNLFVGDMSIYPSSLGVPPQLSAYAAGFYAGDQVLKFLH